MSVSVDSPCRKGQTVNVQYGIYDFTRNLDGGGRGSFVFDLFLGKSEPVKLEYADGFSETVAPIVGDLGDVAKVALIWSAPVDLNLHAFENGAAPGKPGHVWANAAASLDQAKAQISETGLSAGFLSAADDGARDGTKIEVYTMVQSLEQDSGAVTFSLDYVSRGDKPSGELCGTGSLANVEFEVVSTSRTGAIRRESGLVPAVKCGETLAGNSRYLRAAVPDLRFRR